VGQLDTPLGVAQQGRHRKLFNKMAKTRLALLQSRAKLLATAQRTLTEVEVTADQQRKQQGCRQCRHQIKGPPDASKNRLVFRGTGNFQLPATTVHIK